MKRLMLAIAILVPAIIIAQTLVLPGNFIKLNAATGTPVALTNAAFKVKRITFIGNNATRTANTGTVYIGNSATDDSQPIAVASGQSVSLLIPEGSMVDLSQLYLDVATANDGVLIIYE